MATLKPAISTATRLLTSPLLPADTSAALALPTDITAALLKPVAKPTELPILDVNFCGECMPLDQLGVVSRWKRVFSLFKPEAPQLAQLRQRAEAFFPIVDPILEKYGIPSDFRYIPLAESDLRPKAISKAGAAGYWQLMPGTARELGLVVNGKTDERFNVLKATEAACRHLRDLYRVLGSWSLVAAAYNAGPVRLLNQIRNANHRDYYRMKLPRETEFYLFRVVLYKELLSRPHQYASYLRLSPAKA